jgi:hypothetical protein
MLSDLIRKIDAFVAKYCVAGDKDKMKSDLLDLIQESVNHGEDKDQGKIAGIAIKAIKGFFGGKE